MLYIKFQLLKKFIIFLANQIAYQNFISNYEIIRRAAKKNVVGLYKVMYMVNCESTLRIEAMECINNESLN